MKSTKNVRIAAIAAAAVVPVSAAPAAMAAPTPVTYIVGGQAASNPAVVQLQFQQNGGTYGCTGELIAPQWVLTAKHCTDGDTAMNVYFSNSTTRRGQPIAADRLVNSPYGDVALVHLKSTAPVNTFLSLANSYTPNPGDQGTIMGYGLRADRVQPTGLYKANVSVLNRSTDAYNGSAIHVQGIDGASNHGDSGGPLIIGGKVVGVCSTGDSADPGSDINAGSNYANLTGSRSWIRSVSGV